ncbi:MAG: NADH-quinone oxidoreductase subunit A [Polyangia bacterium]|nr:NADH-quinone oxidoreductase subunit A [Polyangia bacterium]
MIIFIFMGLLVVALFYVPALVFGPKVETDPKLEPFECGNEPIGEPTVPFNPRFYQVAILFLVFDVEIAFLYPWAVLSGELGWRGILVMGVFVAVLMVALLFIVKKRVLRFV